MPGIIPKVRVQSRSTSILLRVRSNIWLIVARASLRDIYESVILVIIQNIVQNAIDIVLQHRRIVVLGLKRIRMRSMNSIEAGHQRRVDQRSGSPIQRRQIHEKEFLVSQVINLVHALEYISLHCFVQWRKCCIFAPQVSEVVDVVDTNPYCDQCVFLFQAYGFERGIAIIYELLNLLLKGNSVVPVRRREVFLTDCIGARVCEIPELGLARLWVVETWRNAAASQVFHPIGPTLGCGSLILDNTVREEFFRCK